MTRKPAKRRGKTNAPDKRTASRSMIGVLVLVVGSIVALLIIASNRSNAPDPADLPSVKPIEAPDGPARKIAYEVVNSYPHDRTSFTQGLLWHEGDLYESTGQYGQSKLRRLEFPSGKVLRETKLSPELFGEGLALVGNRLIQLTWLSHRGFVYDLSSFGPLREFSFDTEGWGLTYDGTKLILSDGSSDLFYIDPETFKSAGKLSVKMNGLPIRQLNELEFIDGEIWANVWQTDLILRIDPSTGLVTSFLDLKGILAPSDKTNEDAVLNGIAYDAERKRIFVTGKLWPRIFEIKLKW
jgi:glutamine cyclotransferase